MKNKKVKKLNNTEKTLPKSEYFSWINNTMEGSTEKHTLINLAYFNYLKEKFGMQLDIYAWDAGNLDGALSGYENLDGEKLKKQYPNGYKSVVEKAKLMGTRMGVWCGPDGYGETESDAQSRRELLVNLCKDYNWALFKVDSVCGGLRQSKRKEFEKTILNCQKYSKDLIVLQHCELGEMEKYTLPFFWRGEETYVDVHAYNKVTAPHNRAFMFFRGYSPNLSRLGEDHGVCISSCLDFFEDELIYQAFNHCLILAPEIFANPWLLRDDELPKLARIFNLHRRHRDILVNGMLPPCYLGKDAILRGSKNRRFLATGNDSWQEKIIQIPLNEQIGLKKCKKVAVTLHFPTGKFIGCFDYGSKVSINLAPFRASLIEICDVKVADNQIVGCEYEVIHETHGIIDKINILHAENSAYLYNPKTDKVIKNLSFSVKDNRLKAPVYLKSLTKIEVPLNAKELYENACFNLDNDSLEKRSLTRSGETQIKQVQDARNAFFNQQSYLLRGCDGDIPFDGDSSTIYDTKSRIYDGGCRIDGGCLRINFGGIQQATRIEIEYFESDGSDKENFAEQIVKDVAEISLDLKSWVKAPLEKVETLCTQKQGYFANSNHAYREIDGVRKKAVYNILQKNVAFLKIPEPIDRIYTIKLFNGNQEVVLKNAKANNLFALYESKKCKNALYGKFKIDSLPKYPYLAVACEGETGNENVYCVAKVDGKYHAFPSRAPSYPVNPFEYMTVKANGYYTFYLPIEKEWVNKEIEIYALFSENSVQTDVYLCDQNGNRQENIINL